MHRRRAFVRTILLGIGIAVLAGTETRAQALVSITVGCTLVDDSTPVLYALQAGLFRRAGLDVKIAQTASGAAASAAVIGGRLQFANSSVMTPITAHEKGVPLLIAAPGQLYVGENFTDVVVKADSSIKSGRDLNGAIVATASVTDLAFVAMLAWIDKTGGDTRTVKNIELPLPAMVPALLEGRASAAVMIEPLLSQAVTTGKVRAVANILDAIGKRFVPTAWVTNANWAANNADVVRRFNRVVREAATYANVHRTETAAIQSGYSGVDLQTVLHSVRAVYDEQPIVPQDLQALIDTAVRYKVINQPFAAKELISPAIVNGA